MTGSPLKILVVIPLYNHAATVRSVAERVLRIHDQLLVVDDGSRDAGAAVLEGLDVKIIRQPENRGKGRRLGQPSLRRTGSGSVML